jgi:hypothetical protein
VVNPSAPDVEIQQNNAAADAQVDLPDGRHCQLTPFILMSKCNRTTQQLMHKWTYLMGDIASLSLMSDVEMQQNNAAADAQVDFPDGETVPVNPSDSVVEMQQNSTSAALEVAVETLLNSPNCILVVNVDGATVGYEFPQSDCSAIHIALNSEGQICSANFLSGPHLEQFICLVPADRLESEVNDEVTENRLRAADVADASNSQDANTHNPVPAEVSNFPKRRRGIRNSSLWKRNIRKRNRQSGKSYIDSKGGMERARSVQQRRSCVQCKFKCAAKIT